MISKVLHIPDWLPGSRIKREAREAYAWRNKMVDTPHQYVQERMVSFGRAERNEIVTRYRHPRIT